ncbi:substrate-binding periplasmic protein [Vibrio ouci]|uniref:Transporter substrate-binding domain-containing protein n=1 Tax=Vibrio ouci TaxID=2499078 RepID=A0A4Y8WCB4_9VIBR|nr:transporter substrate-binding domain-containing protein [Vibrio ouci]TFH90296.1 transporter substrate-binding domain-containing protein [Vibrio ouci]
MSKWITILVCLITWPKWTSAGLDVTIYGDDAYPPYSYVESGRLTGIYTVILESAFERMPNFNVTLAGIPWQQGLADIERGNLFALYPPYKRPDLRPFMEYDMPILEEHLVAVCTKSVLSTPRPNWPEDYKGLTIGKNAGFASGGPAFRQLVERGDISLLETRGTAFSLLQLLKGLTDCYINDRLSIQWELKQLAKERKYDGFSVVEATVISTEHGYLGFATDQAHFPFKAAFKGQFYDVLADMKAKGEIEQIVRDFLQN